VDQGQGHNGGSPELSLAAAPGMAACREGGNTKRAMRRDRGTAHWSLDDGEEAVHRRQNFGAEL
jgi:hypothetical protein